MDIKVRITNDEVRISAPYDDDFSVAMRRFNAGWDSELRELVLDIEWLDIVRQKLLECYGMNDLTNDLVDIWVTIPDFKHLDKIQGPVKMFGKVVAVASSKKSGARWGKDVLNMSSDCDSAGSIINWRTWVSPGKFKIKNVSKSRVLDEKEIYEENGLIIEIIEQFKVNKDILLEERKRLLERINEINKMLLEK